MATQSSGLPPGGRSLPRVRMTVTPPPPPSGPPPPQTTTARPAQRHPPPNTAARRQQQVATAAPAAVGGGGTSIHHTASPYMHTLNKAVHQNGRAQASSVQPAGATVRKSAFGRPTANGVGRRPPPPPAETMPQRRAPQPTPAASASPSTLASAVAVAASNASLASSAVVPNAAAAAAAALRRSRSAFSRVASSTFAQQVTTMSRPMQGTVAPQSQYIGTLEHAGDLATGPIIPGVPTQPTYPVRVSGPGVEAFSDPASTSTSLPAPTTAHTSPPTGVPSFPARHQAWPPPAQGNAFQVSTQPCVTPTPVAHLTQPRRTAPSHDLESAAENIPKIHSVPPPPPKYVSTFSAGRRTGNNARSVYSRTGASQSVGVTASATTASRSVQVAASSTGSVSVSVSSATTPVPAMSPQVPSGLPGPLTFGSSSYSQLHSSALVASSNSFVSSSSALNLTPAAHTQTFASSHRLPTTATTSGALAATAPVSSSPAADASPLPSASPLQAVAATGASSPSSSIVGRKRSLSEDEQSEPSSPSSKPPRQFVGSLQGPNAGESTATQIRYVGATQQPRDAAPVPSAGASAPVAQATPTPTPMPMPTPSSVSSNDADVGAAASEPAAKRRRTQRQRKAAYGPGSSHNKDYVDTSALTLKDSKMPRALPKPRQPVNFMPTYPRDHPLSSSTLGFKNQHDLILHTRMQQQQQQQQQQVVGVGVGVGSMPLPHAQQTAAVSSAPLPAHAATASHAFHPLPATPLPASGVSSTHTLHAAAAAAAVPSSVLTSAAAAASRGGAFSRVIPSQSSHMMSASPVAIPLPTPMPSPVVPQARVMPAHSAPPPMQMLPAVSSSMGLPPVTQQTPSSSQHFALTRQSVTNTGISSHTQVSVQNVVPHTQHASVHTRRLNVQSQVPPTPALTPAPPGLTQQSAPAATTTTDAAVAVGQQQPQQAAPLPSAVATAAAAAPFVPPVSNQPRMSPVCGTPTIMMSDTNASTTDGIFKSLESDASASSVGVASTSAPSGSSASASDNVTAASSSAAASASASASSRPKFMGKTEPPKIDGTEKTKPKISIVGTVRMARAASAAAAADDTDDADSSSVASTSSSTTNASAEPSAKKRRSPSRSRSPAKSLRRSASNASGHRSSSSSYMGRSVYTSNLHGGGGHPHSSSSSSSSHGGGHGESWRYHRQDSRLMYRDPRRNRYRTHHSPYPHGDPRAYYNRHHMYYQRQYTVGSSGIPSAHLHHSWKGDKGDVDAGGLPTGGRPRPRERNNKKEKGKDAKDGNKKATPARSRSPVDSTENRRKAPKGTPPARTRSQSSTSRKSSPRSKDSAPSKSADSARDGQQGMRSMDTDSKSSAKKGKKSDDSKSDFPRRPNARRHLHLPMDQFSRNRTRSGSDPFSAQSPSSNSARNSSPYPSQKHGMPRAMSASPERGSSHSHSGSGSGSSYQDSDSTARRVNRASSASPTNRRSNSRSMNYGMAGSRSPPPHGRRNQRDYPFGNKHFFSGDMSRRPPPRGSMSSSSSPPPSSSSPTPLNGDDADSDRGNMSSSSSRSNGTMSDDGSSSDSSSDDASLLEGAQADLAKRQAVKAARERQRRAIEAKPRRSTRARKPAPAKFCSSDRVGRNRPKKGHEQPPVPAETPMDERRRRRAAARDESMAAASSSSSSSKKKKDDRTDVQKRPNPYSFTEYFRNRSKSVDSVHTVRGGGRGGLSRYYTTQSPTVADLRVTSTPKSRVAKVKPEEKDEKDENEEKVAPIVKQEPVSEGGAAPANEAKEQASSPSQEGVDTAFPKPGKLEVLDEEGDDESLQRVKREEPDAPSPFAQLRLRALPVDRCTSRARTRYIKENPRAIARLHERLAEKRRTGDFERPAHERARITRARSMEPPRRRLHRICATRRYHVEERRYNNRIGFDKLRSDMPTICCGFHVDDAAGVGVGGELPRERGHDNVGLFYDMRCAFHFGFNAEPERPSRYDQTVRLLDSTGVAKRCVPVLFDQPNASDEDLLSSHSKTLVGELKRIKRELEASNRVCRERGDNVDSLFECRHTYDAVTRSVKGAMECLEGVVSGKRYKSAMCLTRPPGHHCNHSKRFGFCHANNVAIAVRNIQEMYPGVKVAIFDWDLHHGNGTQEMFDHDPDVLYISTHQECEPGGDLLFPGGDSGQMKKGGTKTRGRKCNVNLNLPIGSGDREFRSCLDHVIVPVIKTFGADVIVISAGFDSAKGDPLGKLQLTSEMYGYMTRRMQQIADGKVVMCLEGGYDPEAVSEGVVECTRALLGDEIFYDPPESEEPDFVHFHLNKFIRFYREQFKRARLRTVDESALAPLAAPFRTFFLMSCMHLSKKLPSQLMRLQREYDDQQVQRQADERKKAREHARKNGGGGGASRRPLSRSNSSSRSMGSGGDSAVPPSHQPAAAAAAAGNGRTGSGGGRKRKCSPPPANHATNGPAAKRTRSRSRPKSPVDTAAVVPLPVVGGVPLLIPPVVPQASQVPPLPFDIQPLPVSAATPIAQPSAPRLPAPKLRNVPIRVPPVSVAKAGTSKAAPKPATKSRPKSGALPKPKKTAPVGGSAKRSGGAKPRSKSPTPSKAKRVSPAPSSRKQKGGPTPSSAPSSPKKRKRATSPLSAPPPPPSAKSDPKGEKKGGDYIPAGYRALVDPAALQARTSARLRGRVKQAVEQGLLPDQVTAAAAAALSSPLTPSTSARRKRSRSREPKSLASGDKSTLPQPEPKKARVTKPAALATAADVAKPAVAEAADEPQRKRTKRSPSSPSPQPLAAASSKPSSDESASAPSSPACGPVADANGGSPLWAPALGIALSGTMQDTMDGIMGSTTSSDGDAFITLTAHKSPSHRKRGRGALNGHQSGVDSPAATSDAKRRKRKPKVIPPPSRKSARIANARSPRSTPELPAANQEHAPLANGVPKPNLFAGGSPVPNDIVPAAEVPKVDSTAPGVTPVTETVVGSGVVSPVPTSASTPVVAGLADEAHPTPTRKRSRSNSDSEAPASPLRASNANAPEDASLPAPKRAKLSSLAAASALPQSRNVATSLVVGASSSSPAPPTTHTPQAPFAVIADAASSVQPMDTGDAEEKASSPPPSLISPVKLMVGTGGLTVEGEGEGDEASSASVAEGVASSSPFAGVPTRAPVTASPPS